MSLEITFRTLKGSTFKLSASESDTILDLKRKVAAKQDVTDFAGYRLIYKGKILSDQATVTACSITASGFVVVMPPKKLPSKPTKAPTTSAPTSTATPIAPSAKPTASDTTKPSSTKNPSTGDMDVQMDVSPPAVEPNLPLSSTASAPTQNATSHEPSSSDAASSLLTGSAYDESVKRICEMGFPEEQVKKAMRAAFNNPDRAVEFIFNGIPEAATVPTSSPPTAVTETITEQQRLAPGAADTTSAPPAPTAADPASVLAGFIATNRVEPGTVTGSATDRSAAPAGTTQSGRSAAPGTPFNMFQPAPAVAPTDPSAPVGQAPGMLDFLATMPLFTQIRRLVQANPAALPQILQHLESINPALMTLIDANQAEFTRIINEPLGEGEEISDEAMEQFAQAVAGGAGDQVPGGVGEGGQVFVTEEENQQIARLTELAHTIGLSQGHVLETWLACNRDETLTANFLVDHADELKADETDDGANNDRANSPDADPGAGAGGPPS